MAEIIYVESTENEFSSGELTNLVVNESGQLELGIEQTLWRKPIFIDHLAGYINKENYPVSLIMNTAELVSAGKLQSDCRDLRFFSKQDWKNIYSVYEYPITFHVGVSGTYTIKVTITDSEVTTLVAGSGREFRVKDISVENPYVDGNDVPFFIDCLNRNAVILNIKVDLLADTPKTVYLYYGNRSAVMKGDDSTVFEFFNDFSSFDGWTVSGPGVSIQNGKLVFNTPSGTPKVTRNVTPVSRPYRWEVKYKLTYGNLRHFLTKPGIDTHPGLDWGNWNSDGWHPHYTFTFNGIHKGHHINDNVICSNLVSDVEYACVAKSIDDYYTTVNGTSAAILDELSRISIYGTGNIYCEIDWCRIRKEYTNQPTYEFGLKRTLYSVNEDIPNGGSIEPVTNHCLFSGANTSTTKIWFRIPEIAAGKVCMGYVEYGDSDRNNISVPFSNFVDWYDDFDDGNYLDEWIGSGSISGGILQNNGNSVTSRRVFNCNKTRIVTRMRVVGSSYFFVYGFNDGRLGGMVGTDGRVHGGRVNITTDARDASIRYGPPVFDGAAQSSFRIWELLPNPITVKADDVETKVWAGEFKATNAGILIYSQGGLYAAPQVYTDWIATLQYDYPDPILTIGVEETINHKFMEGSRITPLIDISSRDVYKSSKIEWTAVEPGNSSINLETNISTDGGVSWLGWRRARNGYSILNLFPDTPMANLKLKIRQTFATEDSLVTPQLTFLKVTIETETKYLRNLLKKDMGSLQDIETMSYNNFDEQPKIRNLDLRLIRGSQAVWQALVGDLKTQRGEVEAYGMETYGCELRDYIGVRMTELVASQIEFLVEEKALSYPEIEEADCTVIRNRTDKKLELKVSIKTIYGKESGVIIID